ncbi:MAG TPA: hypothetical protein ACFE0H_15095 [Elainellaceae cyanobacterium]
MMAGGTGFYQNGLGLMAYVSDKPARTMMMAGFYQNGLELMAYVSDKPAHTIGGDRLINTDSNFVARR